MSNARYGELLRDPRWQRRRLEVMQRACWRCERCGDEKSELQVNHEQYVRGALPWDYPDEDLSCLCRTCHEQDRLTPKFHEQYETEPRDNYLLRKAQEIGLNYDEKAELAEFLRSSRRPA